MQVPDTAHKGFITATLTARGIQNARVQTWRVVIVEIECGQYTVLLMFNKAVCIVTAVPQTLELNNVHRKTRMFAFKNGLNFCPHLKLPNRTA